MSEEPVRPESTECARRSSRADFIRACTTVRTSALVPEIRLQLGDDVFALWERIETTTGPPESALPFWAFAWPGGQALARYLLDHPDCVPGRTVLDLASGSGLVAIAAAKAEASTVVACDLDALAVCAVGLNAALNCVDIAARQADVADVDLNGVEVVLAGDVFYEQALAEAALPTLRRAATAGALVLVGDPDRWYMPRSRLRRACDLPGAGRAHPGGRRRQTVDGLAASLIPPPGYNRPTPRPNSAKEQQWPPASPSSAASTWTWW